MKLIKLVTVFSILSLLISTNIYANNLYIESNSQSNKALVVPALPFIAEGIKDAVIVTGATIGTSSLLKSDTKKPCDPCNPPVGEKFDIEIDTSHDHGNCLGKTGSMTHWHYKVMNQNPNTCECFRSKRKFGGCGTP